jgi:hypothetical protein
MTQRDASGRFVSRGTMIERAVHEAAEPIGIIWEPEPNKPGDKWWIPTGTTKVKHQPLGKEGVRLPVGQQPSDIYVSASMNDNSPPRPSRQPINRISASLIGWSATIALTVAGVLLLIFTASR